MSGVEPWPPANTDSRGGVFQHRGYSHCYRGSPQCHHRLKSPYKAGSKSTQYVWDNETVWKGGLNFFVACDCAPPSLGLYIWLGLTEEFHTWERERERVCLCLFDGLELNKIAHFLSWYQTSLEKLGLLQTPFPILHRLASILGTHENGDEEGTFPISIFICDWIAATKQREQDQSIAHTSLLLTVHSHRYWASSHLAGYRFPRVHSPSEFGHHTLYGRSLCSTPLLHLLFQLCAAQEQGPSTHCWAQTWDRHLGTDSTTTPSCLTGGAGGERRSPGQGCWSAEAA